MTEPSNRPRTGHAVTAVLVTHNGARWLPEVLDGVVNQTHRPDRFIAADTDSADGSPRLVAEAMGPASVVALPRTASYGDAVQAALQAADRAAGLELEAGAEPATEWIWLLHDDCAPDPSALEQLLARAAHSPSVWLIGPKVRGWDGARLLEAGLTIDPTGHIDGGLDGVEIDQGQRDDVDEVLAVGTAGALIRRDVWERLGGLDPAWPTYADDVDLGWRVNAAGGRVVVASRAVVRHVRAQATGRRRSALRPGKRPVLRRRSGMQVVLANTSPFLVPLLLLRYIVGGPLRAVGLLVVSRRPREALAEVRGVVGVLLAPGAIITARRERSRSREVAHRDLRHLFPSASRRWRSSPFRIGWLGSERAPRAMTSTGTETGPVDEEAQSLDTGDSALVNFVRRPGTVLFLAMSLLALVAERHLLSTTLHGGRLLPAPAGSSDLWSAYAASFHPSSVGSFTPAPPSLAILATISTVLFGKAWLVVDVIMLGAVPLSALSAYAASRSITAAVRIRIWVAVVYALLPAVTGAVAGGRIDVVVAAILLPQVLRACVSAINAESVRVATRRGIGAGLVLAVVVAFAPLLWLVAVPVLIVGIGFLERDAHDAHATLGRLGSAAIILAVPVVTLVPWSWHLLMHPRLVLQTGGLPDFYTSSQPPSGIAMALLRAGGVAQPPMWVGAPLVLAALIGLNRRSRVAAARTAVAMMIFGVAVAVALTRQTAVTSGVAASRHWPGLPLLVAGGGALLAALVAAVGARPALRGHAFGWRQPAAVVLIVAALAATGTMLVRWPVRGAGAPLTGNDPHVLPLFTQSELDVKTSPRALVLDRSSPTVRYALIRRSHGPWLGDADTAPQGQAAASRALAAAVRDLVAGRPGAGKELTPFDIGYVVSAAAGARDLGPALGRSPSLTVVPTPGAIVWRSTLPTSELTLLDPTAATQALQGAKSAAVAKALPASPGSADITLPAGQAGRIVVLAEPVSHGWHASVGGHALSGRTAYGWAQAFTVPSAGGRLHISYGSTSRDIWLVVELVAVIVLLGAVLPGRPPELDEDAA
jgi:GT2 family glycosyltransferase